MSKPVAFGLVYVTVGFGITAVLFDVAVTVSVCPLPALRIVPAAGVSGSGAGPVSGVEVGLVLGVGLVGREIEGGTAPTVWAMSRSTPPATENGCASSDPSATNPGGKPEIVAQVAREVRSFFATLSTRQETQ